MANCSSQAVDRALREGQLTRGPKGIDPEHPDNQAFLASHQQKQAGVGCNDPAIAAIIARAELLEHGVDKLEAETISRIAMVALMAYDADLAIEWLEDSPPVTSATSPPCSSARRLSRRLSSRAMRS